MRKFKLFITSVMLFAGILASAQNITVKGVVTDASGAPIPGAGVIVQGTTKGVATGLDGEYSIQVPGNATLVFSSVGYETKIIPVEKKSVINVVLSDDSQMLDETIVVAFGTTTKEAFTGSASVLKADDIQKRQTTNIANALVGSVAGLQMKGASGAPGAGSGSINIRGISSLYAGTDPLVIVDGAPYTASLSNIPQSDIESVTVLKDAASAALYGARGASGVIIVTTKKGRSNDAVVNLDVKWGVNSRSIPDYDFITDPGEYYEAYYAQLYNLYFYGRGQSSAVANVNANTQMLSDLKYQVYTIPDGEQLIGTNGKLNPNAKLGYKMTSGGEDYWFQPENWTDLAYKKALRKEYVASVSGGTDKASFYSSVSYLNEDGVIDFSGYERLSARLKADYQAKKWLKLGANVGFVNSVTTSNPNMGTSLGSTNLMYYTSHIAPIYPVHVWVLDANGNPVIRTDANGNPQYDYGIAGADYPVNRAFLQTGNPIGSNRYNVDKTNGNQMNGNFVADFTISDHLSANITSTVIWGSTRYSHYDNSLYGPKVSVNGQLYKSASTTIRTNNIQSLTYVNQIGDFNVNIIAGHEWYDTNSTSLYAEGQGLYSPQILELNAAANTQYDSGSSSSEYNVEGYFASAQFNYAQKYYASASFRRDATSYFDKDHRWGNFWSLGAAWIVSKEALFGNNNIFDLLKLKASIGQQGNDDIGAWAYTDLYTLSKTGTYTMAPSFARIGNKDITWETTTNRNIGAEFSLYKGRLSGSVDFYSKISDGQLFWLSVAESIGSRGYYGNMGKIRNNGVELVLNADLVRTKDFVWSASFNIASNKDKILELPETKKIEGTKGFTESSLWLEEGGSMYSAFRHVFAGLDDNGQALYWVDDDLNGAVNRPGSKYSSTTTNPNVASYYNLGSMLPKAFGGLSTTIRFKGIDATASFDYQIGGKIYDTAYAGYMEPCYTSSDAGSTFHKDWYRSWSPDNTSSNIPRWQYGDQFTAAASDRFLVNASYFNFQSFSVGYTLPEKTTKGLGISKVRFYAMGENLKFWSARKGLDPRYSYTGNTYVSVYSPVRTISGGVQLTF
ncbi:MAG: SusC/RagA family TonB-linked outer membrane protein [Bacteroidales bacterium]|nr:SusC/RagA family TonB-linked outer membrane protein [Bacteroidales bacterium]